jgi:membrane protease subunit HflC
MKNGFTGVLAAIVAIVVVIGVYWSVFVVDPKQQALVLSFGEVTGTVTEPGLHFKRPWQNVEYLPKFILDLEQGGQEIIAADQKRLNVAAFARYRINNPVQFYQTVRTVLAGNARLQTFMSSSLRAVLADAPFSGIVRDERSKLMDRIKVEMDKRARELGVEVVDVRIRRADLPDQNSRAIFERMKTERQREATELRSKGNAESQRITSRADADKAIIVAEATRDANVVMGEGEAQRARIFADAFGKDQEFFAFYRSLQAYDSALKGGDPRTGDTRLVLSPQSDFFRYFSDPAGRTKQSTQPLLPPVPAPPAAAAPATPVPLPAPAQ